MKYQKTIFTCLASGLLVLAACSEKSFNAASGSVFQQCVDSRPEVKCQVTCEDGSCVKNFNYSVDAQGQITDVLFVVDNSGSMSDEQAEMASKFPSFLETLKNVDYRLAVTTTDISTSLNGPTPNNGYGAFQDGKLISFQNGQSFLDRSVPVSQAQTLFQNTVRRQETLTCEANDYEKPFCPSGDERGTLAAIMAFDRNQDQFIRPMGHMALVILSDENVGSTGTFVDSRESPNQFLNYFRGLYPNKSIKAHSVIIQPNTDIGRSCHSQQASGPGPIGQYGTVYAELSALTSGVIGNICAANYTSQLQAIGEAVSQTREVLPCSPIGGNVKVTFIPEPPYRVEITKNLFQNEILFSRALPLGTKIQFEFQCTDDSL